MIVVSGAYCKGRGLKCSNDDCCNGKFGFCGKGDTYCKPPNCDPRFGRCDSGGIADSNCGPKYLQKNCTGNFKNQCCNKNGFCGLTEDYCEASICYKQFGHCNTGKNDECGPKYGGKNCTGKFKNSCCSAETGKCGSTDEFCEFTVCDPAYGKCHAARDDQCGYTYGGKKCSGVHKNSCCSKSSYHCGTSEEFCLSCNCDRKYGRCDPPKKYADFECGRQYCGKYCSGKYANMCCSKNGNCGTGVDYCGFLKCQAYERCDNCNPTGAKCTSDKECCNNVCELADYSRHCK